MTLYTDDDVTRATDALRRSRFIGCDCCAEYPTCRHGESHWCETCDEAGDHPPGRLEALAQEVLDAVLPAAMSRAWSEGHQAGWEHHRDGTDWWDDGTPNPYRAKAEETP